MFKKFLSSRKSDLVFSLAAFVIIWICWLIAYVAVGNDYVVPSFQASAAEFGKCLGEAEFWSAFSMTLLRTLVAFLISFCSGAVFAVLSVNRICEAFIKPFIVILRTLPTLAIILLLLVWTNANYTPVIVTVLVLFPIVYARISASIKDIDTGLVQALKVYGVSKRDRLFKVYLPLVSPPVFSQTGADFSLGLKVTISAEVMSNTFNSLGGMMQTARSFLLMPRLAALTVVAVIAGLIIDVLLSQLSRLNRKWRKGA